MEKSTRLMLTVVGWTSFLSTGLILAVLFFGYFEVFVGLGMLPTIILISLLVATLLVVLLLSSGPWSDGVLVLIGGIVYPLLLVGTLASPFVYIPFPKDLRAEVTHPVRYFDDDPQQAQVVAGIVVHNPFTETITVYKQKGSVNTDHAWANYRFCGDELQFHSLFHEDPEYFHWSADSAFTAVMQVVRDSCVGLTEYEYLGRLNASLSQAVLPYGMEYTGRYGLSDSTHLYDTVGVQ